MKPTNVIEMPHRISPFRLFAREAIAAYYKNKAKEKAAPTLTQSSIDSKPVGWEKESETTNAKLHRILGGEG